jgi:hypothetical protein
VSPSPGPPPPADEGPDLGTAGTSARREHDRRRANREARTREKHPWFGGLLLSLRDEPTHETAWARGAGGEETVAACLAKRCDDSVVVLHDRSARRGKANIDHIALAPSGVYVIDTKRYQGKVSVAKPLFGSAKLVINGSDQTKLAVGVTRQVEAVRAAVNDIAPGVPVHGVLCFVDGDLPLLGTLSFAGHRLMYPRKLAKALNSAGPVTPDETAGLVEHLLLSFPAA